MIQYIHLVMKIDSKFYFRLTVSHHLDKDTKFNQLISFHT